jgi:hypothetical protein
VAEQKQQKGEPLVIFGRKKPRPLEEVYRDPALLFNAAHLTGVAAVVAHWLSTRADEESKQMGTKLAEAASWFYEDVRV